MLKRDIFFSELMSKTDVFISKIQSNVIGSFKYINGIFQFVSLQ